MRALVQRVSSAGVKVEEANYKSVIGAGMLILLGVKTGDREDDVIFVADKCSNLRIFEDAEGKMNLSLKDTGGEVLVISQFTLYGETAKGNRPNFTMAARPEEASRLYELFIERMKFNLGGERVKSGIFAAMMDVSLVNAGPVTVMVESKEK
ncbi:MAG: D-tyrosyl-tRNA(Tyr) deacylase [Ignavibacteriaceae bacterium]|nr:D-tyrosyl-tRNA(Tyr) deacylase [Ignavibacteriaceae bacterium]